MAGALGILVFAGAAVAVESAPPPGPADWAFPPRRSEPATAIEKASRDARVFSLPGSDRHFTGAQLRDLSHAIDWWPSQHPEPPSIVMNGHPPDGAACGFCHLPDGRGRPENATLAGLSAAYIAQQVADMRGGARVSAYAGYAPATMMRTVAMTLDPADIAAAAKYFSGLKFKSSETIVETQTIPAMVQGGFVYRRAPNGPAQPLGDRIIEVPDDFDRFELRDPTMRYTAYVPPGAVARGQALALTGGEGRTQPCGACHGSALRGDIGPPLAGRSPSYIYRQLLAFHTGARHGANGAPMTLVAANLTSKDMIDLAAYAASRKP